VEKRKERRDEFDGPFLRLCECASKYADLKFLDKTIDLTQNKMSG
jgi:hypothetical protein